MSMEEGGAAHDLSLRSEPAAESAVTPATPGELLRTAREDRDVSIQQVADDLHLDVRVVQAIEANNFALLGPPVYSRGHLRKYATLVGLAPELVISHYELLSEVPAAPMPAPVSATVSFQERPSLRMPLLIGAGVVIAAVVLWIAGWLVNQLDTKSPSVPEAQPVAQQAPTSYPIEARAAQQPAGVPEVNAAGAAVAAPPVTESRLARSGNDVTMRLRFSDASWVEVNDATNRRLMYEIGQAGQAKTLSGVPPLRVTFGLASAVSLEINDRSIVVPRQSGKDAARFVVNADGSVR